MITLGLQEKNTFLEAVNKTSGANVLECYQCGKCVSTCPFQITWISRRVKSCR